jgi:hypothetical protein
LSRMLEINSQTLSFKYLTHMIIFMACRCPPAMGY